MLQISSGYAWLWTAIIDLVHKQVLGVYVSRHRNMLVAEQFTESLIRKYGEHNITTEGGTWYLEASRFLKVKHHTNSSIERSFIERTIQYIKERTKCFNNYFPCTRINCKLEHVINWLDLFG